MIKHIMFDLDGTLLPLRLETFTTAYMQSLGKRMATLGYDPKLVVKAVWEGTFAMLKNDGTKTNREVFWETFQTFGFENVELIEQQVDSFYVNEFREVRKVLLEQRNLRNMIEQLKEKGYAVTLATSPIFPLVGVEERLSWLGLGLDDFGVVTSYETSTFCKPQLGYYKQVLERSGFSAQESLMVGNDITDDMPAKELGITTFLVTDVLEHETEDYQQQYTHGTFLQLQEFLKNLPKIKG